MTIGKHIMYLLSLKKEVYKLRDNIKSLLNSKVSSYYIAKKTKVNVSVISRIRNGERGIGRLSLDSAEKLNEYAIDYLNRNNLEIKKLEVELKKVNTTLNDFNLFEDEEQILLEKKMEIENKIEELSL
ncbi:hypothetical protein [Mammaliicoccus sciuri]|uniref:hypothetical protein n=2 Tax=Mammaliicoccus sciuri TaxID=1296 RepID=UPI0015F7FFF1|nr:hypothetical protein [Mammaliicoccus sciuri]MEB6330708.1 hypothetical protein [Mammaliicoccus sciuri]